MHPTKIKQRDTYLSTRDILTCTTHRPCIWDTVGSTSRDIVPCPIYGEKSLPLEGHYCLVGCGSTVDFTNISRERTCTVLRVEPVRSSESSVNVYQTVWCHFWDSGRRVFFCFTFFRIRVFQHTRWWYVCAVCQQYVYVLAVHQRQDSNGCRTWRTHVEALCILSGLLF
jgi:hypothetical protein